jgi:hypothetical protein
MKKSVIPEGQLHFMNTVNVVHVYIFFKLPATDPSSGTSIASQPLLLLSFLIKERQLFLQARHAYNHDTTFPKGNVKADWLADWLAVETAA